MAKGIADRIGLSSGWSITHKTTGKDEVVLERPLPDHRTALQAIEETLVNPELWRNQPISKKSAA